MMIRATLSLVVLVVAGCATVDPRVSQQEREKKRVAGHLDTFDALHYDLLNHRKWDLVQATYHPDVSVFWPDGHKTSGADHAIAGFKALFDYAPDTRIEAHPIKFGEGKWTCTIGVMEGTFSRPMPLGPNRTLHPTNKPFKIAFCSVGQWNFGVMERQYLYWDNQEFMMQIGVPEEMWAKAWCDFKKGDAVASGSK